MCKGLKGFISLRNILFRFNSKSGDLTSLTIPGSCKCSYNHIHSSVTAPNHWLNADHPTEPSSLFFSRGLHKWDSKGFARVHQLDWARTTPRRPENGSVKNTENIISLEHVLLRSMYGKLNAPSSMLGRKSAQVERFAPNWFEHSDHGFSLFRCVSVLFQVRTLEVQSKEAKTEKFFYGKRQSAPPSIIS